MPIYKAPVDEVLFLLNDVFQIARYNNLPGFADASPDLLEPILGEAAKLCEEVVQPLNLPGDEEGCTRHDDGSVTTPKGFKDGLPAICRGRLDGHFGARRIRRPGPAGDDDRRSSTRCMASANMAFAMYPGLTQGAIAAILQPRHAGAEGGLSAEDDRGPLDRHHESDRAALRHRSRAPAHQGGQAGRRQLQDHRHQDLHLGRRARSRPRTSCISCSRASRARPAGIRGITLFIVPKIPAQRRRLARARATASPAARSKRRWASTPTRPA